MRIPADIQAQIQQWSGVWYSVGINGDREIGVKHYSNGEAVAVYGRAGREYCLWSVRQCQRLATYRTARELWAAVREMLERGPDRFGMAQI